MTANHRTSRIVLAALCVATFTHFAPGHADAATECRVLRAGYNGLSYEQACYAFDVPESVDMLRLELHYSSWGGTRESPVLTLTQSVDPGEGRLCWLSNHYQRYCSIPGPEAERLYLHLSAKPRRLNPFGVTVEFAEAVPVTGGTLDRTLDEKGDARMYRFDKLETAAIISAASGDDVDLVVRRGVPPSRSESDCTSAGHTTTGGVRIGGPEACRLDAAAAPIYAFVTFEYDVEERLGSVYGPPGWGNLLDLVPCPMSGIWGCSYLPDAVSISGIGP